MSGIADQLKLVQRGDPIPHDQWNLMVRCAQRDVTGAGIVSHLGGWAFRPQISGQVGSKVDLCLLTGYEEHPSLVLLGRDVTIVDQAAGLYELGDEDETYRPWPGVRTDWYRHWVWIIPEGWTAEDPISGWVTFLPVVGIGNERHVVQIPKKAYIEPPDANEQSECVY